MKEKSTSRMQRVLDTLANLPGRGFQWISGACVLIIMALLVSNIIIRAVAHTPILGTMELTEYLMAFVVFFALGFTQVYRRHIRVDVLEGRLPKKVVEVLDGIASILGFVVFALVAWQSAAWGINLIRSGQVGMIFGLRDGIFFFVVTIGSILFCLVLLAHSIEYFQKVSKQ